jgi:hypothetical protein
LDKLGKAAARGPQMRQTESFDIFLMPEGNGDVLTIPVKKSEVYTLLGINFGVIKGAKLFVIGPAKSFVT